MNSVTCLLRGFALTLLFGAVSGPTVAAQVNPTYRHYPVVLDRLFHVDSPRGVYVLRYSRSSLEQEMQIVFSVPFDTDCSVKVWHLPQGSDPLLVELYPLFGAQPSLTPEDVIGRVSVLQRTVNLPCNGSVAALLRTGPSVPIRIPSEYGVAVDGVMYRLESFMGASSLRYEATGGSFNDPGDDAIIRWMASVGLAIRSLLSAQPGVSQ